MSDAGGGYGQQPPAPPPGAPLSADRRFWWDGQRWRRVPSRPVAPTNGAPASRPLPAEPAGWRSRFVEPPRAWPPSPWAPPAPPPPPLQEMVPPSPWAAPPPPQPPEAPAAPATARTPADLLEPLRAPRGRPIRRHQPSRLLWVLLALIVVLLLVAAYAYIFHPG
ncbi:MAG: hypothetical protein ACLQT7_03290 [Candidatus Dormibacteria bacterium]